MKFFVPCLPVAQPRPKATTAGGFTRMYEAKKSHPIHDFKASVKMAWRDAGAVKMEGPLTAVITLLFDRPAKVPKKLGAGRLPKAKKPDLDNLAKGILDSLNKLAYDDDGQIVQLVIEKYHAAEGETPGAEVAFYKLTSERLEIIHKIISEVSE